ncbi:MAG: BatA domain-containing protein [Pirellulaceae bacterium]|nr:BatA domain-containing protein [Pirellulaceae bacterium]
MNFLHSPLTWGFLAVSAPVIIHLINLIRQRRVRWAAMEFLLKSYRKSRRWVWLKQLLLLMMRMAMIALVVAMVAKPIAGSRLSFFQNATMHHYILLDDSYSMGERVGAVQAFDQSLEVIRKIVKSASDLGTKQKITLLRFSHAQRMLSSTVEVGPEEVTQERASEELDQKVSQFAEFYGYELDSSSQERLEEKLTGIQLSFFAAEPEEALEVTYQLILNRPSEQAVIHLLSDFRNHQWQEGDEVGEWLDKIAAEKAEVNLVQCIKEAGPNLAITDLRPTARTRAAGVSLPMIVEVTNYGDQTAKNVKVNLQSIFYDSDEKEIYLQSQQEGTVWEADTTSEDILIEEIEPGKSVSATVQVYFPKRGQHIVRGILPDDPLLADNSRMCVVALPDHEKVLLINGNPLRRDAYHLGAVFDPDRLLGATGGQQRQINNGIVPDVREAAFLREVTPQQLEDYTTIYLLDVNRLEPSSVAKLETFVRRGGGVGIFAGPSIEVENYNEAWYRKGEGLLPLPLLRIDRLPERVASEAFDFQAQEHPIFEGLSGEGNLFLRSVLIDRFFKIDQELLEASDVEKPGVVLAHLRSQAPLVAEKGIGKGKVIFFLSTYAPDWNSFASSPGIVIFTLNMQSYLGSGGYLYIPRQVGHSFDIATNPKFQSLTFTLPGTQGHRTVLDKTDRLAAATRADESVIKLGQENLAASHELEVSLPGVYEVWTLDEEGKTAEKRFVLNVDPKEGDLAAHTVETLSQRYSEVSLSAHRWDSYLVGNVQKTRNSKWSEYILYLLVLLFCGEQFVAYLLSYHPKSMRRGT